MKTFPFLRLAALACMIAIASAAESANYSLLPMAQAAGGRATSTNYTLDSSSETGGATASVVYQTRGGFSGSLYDTAALELTASPSGIAEGGTSQFMAWLRMDDDSLSLLSPTSVGWSVLSGPASVNANGVVTAGNVTQTSTAFIGGTWQSLAATLGLQVFDGFYDYASDNLPDAWQISYFGAGNPLAAPGMDPDGDGWNNEFEFTAGLDPTNPMSTFNIRLEGVPGQPGQRRIIFSPRLVDRVYTVVATTSLSGWLPLAGSLTSDAGNERTVTDTTATPAAKFYRINILFP